MLGQSVARGGPLAAVAPVSAAPRRGRNFYVGMAVACAAIAFLGFAPTFFLKRLFDSPPLPLLVNLHGLVFTAWVVLLLAQTTLVRAGRTDLHRRLGIAGLVLAATMVVLGVLTAIGGARRGVALVGMDPLGFMAVPLAAIALFLVFVVLGALNRRKPEHHKRLMLLATFSIMTPAFARMAFAEQDPFLAFLMTMALVLVAIVYDRRLRHRIHPVYLWGGLLILVSGPGRFALGQTEAWHTLARALIQ